MLKPVLVTLGAWAGAVALCGVLIVLGVSIGGHHEGPLLVTLALELSTFVGASALVFRTAKTAAPQGPTRWVFLLVFLLAAGLTLVPLGIASALSFDH